MIPEDQVIDIIPLKKVRAIDFLLSLRPALPLDSKGAGGGVQKPPSNSEVRRWLDQKAVLINGVTPAAEEAITFPVTQCVIFYNAKKRKTTLF